MDRPSDYHTKWSRSDRERQIPYTITYMWSLKHNTNELIYKTETDSEITDLTVASGGGGDLCLPRGGQVGTEKGWTGNLGLTDANHYT